MKNAILLFLCLNFPGIGFATDFKFESFEKLPQSWRGLSCDSYRFFLGQEREALEDFLNLFEEGFLLAGTGEFQVYNENLYDRWLSGDQSYLDHESVKVQIRLSNQYSRGIKKIIGVNSIHRGFHMIHADWLNHFGGSSFSSSNQILNVEINVMDLCLRGHLSLVSYEGCSGVQEPSTICYSNGRCESIPNGFHPNMCKNSRQIKVDLSSLAKALERGGHFEN